MKNKGLLKVILKIVSPVAGKKSFQGFFEALNQFSLLGMNIGSGARPGDSGEKFALEYIKVHFNSVNQVVIFDVGANAGYYSKLIKDVMGGKAVIYAFEPSIKTFRKLSENLKGQSGITLFNLGLGDENKKMVLFSNSEGSGLASVYQRKLDHLEVFMDHREEVEISTLDSFCQEHQIDHIHFLKLDVEGHEKKVLEGSKRMLALGAIDFIQFEFGGCNIDSRTYFQDFYYLLKDRYKIYRILKDGLFQIKQYKEVYEVFTTTNFLAEKMK